MYKQIIESYYRDSDGESHYFVKGDRDMVVIPSFGTDECTLYETARACFEERVKPELEDRYEPEGLGIAFAEEELDFMERQYPGSILARMIAEGRNDHIEVFQSLVDYLATTDMTTEREDRALRKCLEDLKGTRPDDPDAFAATEKLIGEVEYLNGNTPVGLIFDADTILSDMIEDSDHHETGLAQSIFDIWKSSADKKAVEEVFYGLVGMEFRQYLLKCKEEITR